MAGFLARLAGGLLRDRTLQAGTGISISNPAGEAGDPTITCTVSPGTGTVTHTGSLTANDLVLGNGTADITSLGSAGTTHQVLHGNAAGAPSFSAVDQAADVTGVLPIANGGTNSSTSLSGSSIMKSDGSKIVQGPAGTTTTVLHGNAAGAPTYSAVDLTADVTGDLPLANLAQGTALSVLGVAGNATADEASIVAGSDGNVLRRSGTSVGFGAIALGSSNAVSGTLADGNLSSNVALKNINNHMVAQSFVTGCVVDDATPALYWHDSSGAANNKFSNIIAHGGFLGVRMLDDALALQSEWLWDRFSNIAQFGGQIAFPATQNPSAGANVLDDYEEGTWTPTDSSGAGLTLTIGGAAYTKIGRAVVVTAAITYPATGSGSSAQIGGLPFTAYAGIPGGGGACNYSTPGFRVDVYVRESTTHIELFTTGGVAVTNTQMSTQTIYFTGFYLASA